MEKELQIAHERIRSVMADAGTTNSNYEEQMSMMSEHVANMNEKLADKTDQIQVIYIRQQGYKNPKTVPQGEIF